MNILLDTNIYSDFMKRDRAVGDILRTAGRIYVPTVVLGELFYGFTHGKFRSENLAGMKEFLALPSVDVISIDYETAEEYGMIAADLRSRGTPLPTNDVWIAALAIRFHLQLVTRDSHFEKIPGLKFVSPE